MDKTCVAGIVAWLLVFAAGFGIGAQQPPSGWKPPIETEPVLMVRASPYDMSGGLFLPEDEFFGMVFSPTFRSTADLCPTGMTVGVADMPLDPGHLQTAAVAWHVAGRLVERREGEATFDLKWTRRVNRPDIGPADAFSSAQRVTLREGESRMLDLVRTSSPGAECQTFGFTYELQFNGPDGLSDAAIAYDLWLVQQDGDGELVTDRYQVTAKQGRQVDYFFRPIGFTAGGRRSAPGAEAIVMNVRGNIRGRVRSDGDIDLTVDAMRGFRAVPPSGGASGHGRSLVTVKPGETIEVPIDLPIASVPNFPNVNQVFGNHRTAVRITAKRVW